ncbi:hypothetical protein K2173_017269 [Erythroxylum novogranatense]|uniref:Fe2OG dioxygenase domain-containing protein n=1 Tax=Erythroxylum novogranatense TaxID=1862640 RepID=A0AAV8U6C6_9ROSI|nr:hypothetical protein K2173_017269 [Erythroxylum novogranatense]
MAVVPKNLEWSLPVPSVQELASQKLDTVSLRYIRDDRDDIVTVQPCGETLHVPLVDMTNLVKPESQVEELRKFHSACKDWGVFQLINHGVPHESLKNTGKQAHEFFELPLNEKQRWAHKPGSLQGYGQAFVVSEEQKLEWSDMIFLEVLPIHDRNLEFWPEKPQQFREMLEMHGEYMKQVTISITRLIAKGLGIEDQKLCKAYEKGRYGVRINFYPPCPEPDRVVGASAHADISGISLLLDYGKMPGLQVLKDEKWVFVEPVDGAIVVIIGQMTEIMSNGIYKAVDHRAVVNKSKERLSVVTFCYPDSSVDIGPVKELTDSGIRPLYKTVTQEEYYQKFFNRKLEVSFIDGFKN